MAHLLKFILALCFVAGSACSAEGRLVVGSVIEIVSYPHTDKRCPPSCPPDSELEARSGICISLSCGCAEAKVEVAEVIFGSSLGGERVIAVPHRLSEFCHSSYPLGGEPAVFYSNGLDESGWATIIEDSAGRRSFQLNEIDADMPPEIERLSGEDGLIPIDGILRGW